jgi:hypothetical protein
MNWLYLLFNTYIVIYCIDLLKYLSYESYYEVSEKIFNYELFEYFQLPHMTQYFSIFATHIVSSVIWMLFGVILFNINLFNINLFNTKKNKYHKIIGYIYYSMGSISALTSIPMAIKYRMNNIIIIFSIVFATLYFLTMYLALYNIYNKNIKHHQYFNKINMSIGIGSIIMRPIMYVYILAYGKFTNIALYSSVFTISALISFIGSVLYALCFNLF